MIENIFNPYLMVALLTLVPFLELRASIPYGIIMIGKESWPTVFLIAVAVNIILGPLIYFVLDRFLHLFLKINFFKRIWKKVIAKTQRKIKKYVDKYGVLGLSIFIGIPLPGSGVYSGAIGAFLLGYTHKEFFRSTVIGCRYIPVIKHH